MGLTGRIQSAQRRKAIRFVIAQANGRREMAQAIAASTDGGLLVHVKAEVAK